MKVLRINEYEVPDELIERDRLFSVFVFGLHRSGTSMMTKICELLGVNMVYTSEEIKDKTDNRFKKQYGDYHANPKGFNEVTKDFTGHYMKIASTPYSGCKMIIPVCGNRWEWVSMYPSKVILMMRDLEEIRQSQMAYFKPQGVDVAYIRTALVSEKIKLRDNNIDFITVNYREVLDNPIKEISKVARFLNAKQSILEAVKSVDKKQNRFKKEELVSGL